MKKILLYVALILISVTSVYSNNINGFQTKNIYVDQQDTIFFNFTVGGEYKLKLYSEELVDTVITDVLVDEWEFSNANTTELYNVITSRNLNKQYTKLFFTLSYYNNLGVYVENSIGDEFSVLYGLITFDVLPIFNYLRDSEIKIVVENPYLKYTVEKIYENDTTIVNSTGKNIYTTFINKLNPVKFKLSHNNFVFEITPYQYIQYNGIDIAVERIKEELNKTIDSLNNIIISKNTIINNLNDTIIEKDNIIENLNEYILTLHNTIDSLNNIETMIKIHFYMDSQLVSVKDEYVKNIEIIQYINNTIIIPNEIKSNKLTYKIYDYNGKLVYELNNWQEILNDIYIDLNNGVYFIVFYNGDNTFVYKIIK